MDVHNSEHEQVDFQISIPMLISAANDGHDTSVTTAGKWARSFLTPLLSNVNFMKKTLVLLSKFPDLLGESG